MHAAVGDEIVIDTETLGARPRRGQVIEVLAKAGEEHYRVVWRDGRESVLFPGPDAHITHEQGPSHPGASAPRREAVHRVSVRRRRTELRPGDPIRSIMAAPVAEIDAQATLREVADGLTFAEVGALLVVDGTVPLGVVSERDVVHTLARGGDADQAWAVDLVAPETVWASPKDSIRYVAGLMWEAEVRHIPLREEGKVVGIVSIRDVLDVLFQSWERR
jgi:CBS domain-containing protein